MLRSPHWIGDVSGRTGLLTGVSALVLLFSRYWVAGAVAAALVPLVLLGWLALFRRAEARGKVAEAEEEAARHRLQWRNAGPFQKAGAIAIAVLVLAVVVLLRYLEWRWDLEP